MQAKRERYLTCVLYTAPPLYYSDALRNDLLKITRGIAARGGSLTSLTGHTLLLGITAWTSSAKLAINGLRKYSLNNHTPFRYYYELGCYRVRRNGLIEGGGNNEPFTNKNTVKSPIVA